MLGKTISPDQAIDSLANAVCSFIGALPQPDRQQNSFTWTKNVLLKLGDGRKAAFTIVWAGSVSVTENIVPDTRLRYTFKFLAFHNPQNPDHAELVKNASEAMTTFLKNVSQLVIENHFGSSLIILETDYADCQVVILTTRPIAERISKDNPQLDSVELY